MHSTLPRFIQIEIQNLPRISQKGQRLSYSKISSRQFQIIMNFLLKYMNEELPIISAVAQQTGVCYNTINSWKNRLHENSDFNPKKEHDLKHRAMSPRLEEQIVSEIENNFLLPGYFFNNNILKIIALAAFESAPEEDKYTKKFKASSKWCKGFRIRHGYVWRKAHYKRRPIPNIKTEAIAAKFHKNITSLYQFWKKSKSTLFTCKC